MLTQVNADKFYRFVELGTVIGSSYSDKDRLILDIASCSARLCNAEASCFFSFNDNENILNLVASHGFADDLVIKQLTVGLGEGISGWIAETRKPILINGKSTYTERLIYLFEQTGFPVKSLLAVPVQTDGVLYGVVEVVSKIENAFKEDDIEWLSIFAGQAGISLENSKKYYKIIDKLSTLQGQFNTGIKHKTIIAKSPIMQDKLDMISRLAKTDSSVLILGESGVGKELIAEQLHLLSPRKSFPFVRVNCASLNSELAESELFGHVTGAFTGAVETRMGRFELANSGTIFLDEIADIPLSLQAKLLRVLQQKTFEKVGSDIQITVDVRILAATNRDIEKLVEEGKFRKDLFYRLNVLPIVVPSLRQRIQDIPELAVHFLQKFMKETKKHFEGFSQDAIDAMISHQWPGNVRELENCIERACVACKTQYIERRDLFLDKNEIEGDNIAEGKRDLKSVINVFKSHFVRKILEENNWNRTKTAAALDIQRTYLSRLMKELNINKT